MNFFVYLIYSAIVGLIRIFKFIEYRILLLFTPILKKKGIAVAESIGVILHCPGKNEVGQVEKAATGKYNRAVHIKVSDNKMFARLANLGTLGFGEAYMDKTWDVDDPEDITELGTRNMENNLFDYFYNVPYNRFFEWCELYAFNLQTKEKAFEVGKVHYDIGNSLFEQMLDPWMQYTCGYWKEADNLNDAQIAKMDLIAKKLELKPGMRVLDIGCGWGTLCKYLAINYQVECVGVTISKEGLNYGKEICKGLPIELRLQDYRELNEKFDRIVSVGMFEAVGYWNFKEYFRVAERCLVDDGLFLLHTIGRNHFNYPGRSDPWSHKYIFPNCQVPSPEDIAKTTKNLFVIEDWHNFGMDYAKTLYCWRENFIRNWPKLEDRYGEEFYRMWIAYLSLARAMFRSRRLHLWQIVFSKDGLKRDYRAVR